ncbi:molybdopterin synthase catalytic subunit [Aquihabitans sp. McL0605]|uniref:molybdopterin synthase catalytic subunit n=1 Tax=Aquihabitans sp. McL0605 TaxID=3415671 RepID=UPI003CF084C1
MTADVDAMWLPPAGDDWLACADTSLPVSRASEWVVRPGTGASITFVGTVRDHAGDRTGVHQLEYEAYTEQVVPVLAVVAAATRSRFPEVDRLVLWHRTGTLAVTESAVVVAVSTPHRDAAFDAARWAIDEVKATAPIWKREHWDGGHDDWGRCDHRAGHDVAGLHDRQEAPA